MNIGKTLFAQLTWRESLRDIEICLTVNRAKLFHMGIKHAPARATLADALNLLDLRSAIPAFIHISDGKMHDVVVLGGAMPSSEFMPLRCRLRSLLHFNNKP